MLALCLCIRYVAIHRASPVYSEMLYMGTGLATTILVAIIKAHRNRKTNLNAKSNPNPDLQKTCKKKLKEKRTKNYNTHGGI